MVCLTPYGKPCMLSFVKEKIMRIPHYLIVLSILVFCGCSTTSNFKSLAQGDVGDFLKNAPRAEDHPNAGASLVDSHAFVEYFRDGTSVTRRLERYKIFNERGRRFATKTISYRQGYQKARILFANTVKADGRIIPLSQSDIQDESQYRGYEFYTDIRRKRFTMRAVEDGCIVEFAYEIKNLSSPIAFDFFSAFIYENLFPIQNDILEVVLPASVPLNYKYLNISAQPVISTSGDRTKYVFINEHKKEIIPEPRMPSVLDRETFPQVWMWTLTDWRVISSLYGKIFNEQLKSNRDLEDFTHNLVARAQTREEKIKIIFDFVARRIRYIAVLMGPHTHQPHPAEEVFQKRYGDCKDKTVLLLTMLKIAGIEGYPALVPTHREHFDTTMPSMSAFNHVMAVVPEGDRYFWLDATNETAAFDTAPFIQPTTVLIIRPDGSYRFEQTPPLDDQNDYVLTDLTFKIDSHGNAQVILRHEYSGKAAEAMRFAYKYLPPEQRKTVFEKKGIEVWTLETGSFDDTQRPFYIYLTGNIKNLVQIVDADTMILSNALRMDTFRDITASQHRRYPIVFRPSFLRVETLRYIFPEGFRLKNIPRPFVAQEKYHFRDESFHFEGSTFTVSTIVRNKTLRISTEEISLFKDFALKLQAHESSMQSLIFERRD